MDYDEYQDLKKEALKKYKDEPEKSRALCSLYFAQYNLGLVESSVSFGGLKGLVDEEDFNIAMTKMEIALKSVPEKIKAK